ALAGAPSSTGFPARFADALAARKCGEYWCDHATWATPSALAGKHFARAAFFARVGRLDDARAELDLAKAAPDFDGWSLAADIEAAAKDIEGWSAPFRTAKDDAGVLLQLTSGKPCSTCHAAR